jgi:hypothetical protein
MNVFLINVNNDTKLNLFQLQIVKDKYLLYLDIIVVVLRFHPPIKLITII